MTCTICPNWHECADTFRIGSYCHRFVADNMIPRDTHEIFTRRLRLCTITGKYDYVGSDGMTKAERENYEAIKKIWQQ